MLALTSRLGLAPKARGYAKEQLGEAHVKDVHIARVHGRPARSYAKRLEKPTVVKELKEDMARSRIKVKTKKRGRLRPCKGISSKGYDVQSAGGYQRRRNCGRAAGASNKRASWPQRSCQGLPTYQQTLDNSPSVQLGEKSWRCTACTLEGKKLRRLT